MKLNERVTFQREAFSGCIAEAKPLIEAHWAEIAVYPDIPLNPQYAIYEQIEASGHLRVYTLRDDGHLKGYCVFVVKEGLHYGTSLQSAEDVIYLDPELRGVLLGTRFIQWCDEQLKAEGVQVVTHHVKCHFDWGSLLKRLGYAPVETVWSKRLDR